MFHKIILDFCIKLSCESDEFFSIVFGDAIHTIVFKSITTHTTCI